MRHEKLIEKHLGINTPDWVKEKVNNAIDEALGYNLKKSEELTPYIKYHLNGNVCIKGQKNSKGQEEGIWELFYGNGNIRIRTPYKEDKKDGIEEVFYENGNIQRRIPFKGGKIDGIEEEFDEQGNIIRTRHWKNGQLIEETKPELTPHIMYHNNGNVWIKGQKNSKGQQEGIWECFYADGNIEIRTPYKEDKRDGIMEWFDKQGNIIKTRLWKDGKLIEETKPKLTPYIEYYTNGNVRVKGQGNSVGQREGLWEWFYENGNIERRTPYVGGEVDGIQEVFDEQGNITQTRLWKDGKLIEETKPKPQPDPQLIDYMAMRYRHDFGFLDEKHKESIRTTMKQLWEEVVGLGFYKPK